MQFDNRPNLDITYQQTSEILYIRVVYNDADAFSVTVTLSLICAETAVEIGKNRNVVFFRNYRASPVPHIKYQLDWNSHKVVNFYEVARTSKLANMATIKRKFEAVTNVLSPPSER